MLANAAAAAPLIPGAVARRAGLFGAVTARLQRRWHRTSFERVVRGVLAASPLMPGSNALTLVSMVQSSDTLAYLLALLSFARYARPARVVVVADASMTVADLNVLRHLVPHIEIRRVDEFRHPGLPSGGCWERLTAITEYVRDSYVIQLDADTVALARPDEVLSAVAGGHGFVLGERPGQQLCTLDEASAYAAQWQPPDLHVQALAEQLLPRASIDGQRYVRGCAAFTGFPRTDDLKLRLVAFSQQMRELCGERWSEWGTEQVASNHLAANLDGTTVLPFPSYGTPDAMGPNAKFVHFIGSQRFETGHYARVAQQVIQELRAGS